MTYGNGPVLRMLSWTAIRGGIAGRCAVFSWRFRHKLGMVQFETGDLHPAWKEDVHPKVVRPVTVSGAEGDDCLHYQEKAVRLAIEESKR